MFKIDLLKGQNVPVRSNPAGVALAVMPFLVPLAAAIVMVGTYLAGRVELDTRSRQLGDCEVKLKQMTGAGEFLRDIESKHEQIDKCLLEVSQAITEHMQWSGVLVGIVDSLPETVTLDEMTVKRVVSRKNAQKRGAGSEKNADGGYRYTLQLSAENHERDQGGAAIRRFIQRLRESDSIGWRFEDIRVVSNQSSADESEESVRYEIDCVFNRASYGLKK